MESYQSLDDKTFKSLSRIYITALAFIAFLVLISQIFIQRALADNEYDAKIINIAGKQRMLSQKISKNLLLLNNPIPVGRDVTKEIKANLAEWKDAHLVLSNNLKTLPKSAQKEVLAHRFNLLNEQIDELLEISRLALLNFNTDTASASLQVNAFLQKEPLFLSTMNQYVNDYESLANTKIKTIKKIEYAAFIFLILLLLIEFFFLFLPAAKKIKGTIIELVNAKNNAIEMAQKANVAVQQKNDTLEELQLLQKAINQHLFFARIDKAGRVITTGRRLKELLDKQSKAGGGYTIYQSLGLSELDEIGLKEAVLSEKGAVLNREFKVSLQQSAVEWLDISALPVVKEKGVIEYILVCLDVTSRKKAQFRIDALNKEQTIAERATQKARASMIVEAQEEERKRIAKDIHDSIGQMLTALKFNLESLDPLSKELAPQQIENLKMQTKDIILGVRMATFNLTPPELLDYGVVTAIQKMVNQLNKYSAATITLQNETPDSMRFESLVETNLYRVTQECINNAIKYAEAQLILVSIKKTDQLLSISITDNGKGFDKNKLPAAPKGGTEGGLGLFFMRERMEYINGRIFLNSEPGNGTRVVLNYPLA